MELPVTGEVPIYAMTARDEITFKTPDALMNGASTVQVIESCCPAIKDAWKMPAVDLDPVLIAIRLATYGKELGFTSVCPHCGIANEKAIDLTVMLDRVVPSDWSVPIKIDGLEIILKPQSYEDFNKNNLMRFEEQRIMQIVQNDELNTDEKTLEFNKVFQRLLETGIHQVSKSIAGIKLEDNTVVNDPEHIKEFLDNCNRPVWEAIKNKLDEIKTATDYNNITVTCEGPECTKEFVTPFVFEQSNFFE
jgi:hypothetical protein